MNFIHEYSRFIREYYPLIHELLSTFMDTVQIYLFYSTRFIHKYSHVIHDFTPFIYEYISKIINALTIFMNSLTYT